MTTATQELPDLPIEEIPLNPRTRRSLAAAGIRTADDLQRALLADGIPGVGPKGLDDIERAIEEAFDSAEVREGLRRKAVADVLRENDRLAELLMLMVDLCVHENRASTERQMNAQALRAATGRTIRESLRTTYEALQVFAPELA